MDIDIQTNKKRCGIAAADRGADSIRAAIERHGEATIIVATGASQFEVLASLSQAPDIDWKVVTVFHLDEYLDLPEDHAASFRGYLKTRFLDIVGEVTVFHGIDGEQKPISQELTRINSLLSEKRVDVAFIGIGENGHLAFNDPPADFETTDPYILVELDDACRRQQWGEGWFPSLDSVPSKAISMSIRQIMKSQELIVTVPDARKSEAVQLAVEGPLTNQLPASILRTHPNATLFLDTESASKLS